jgi:hypothetical protein
MTFGTYMWKICYYVNDGLLPLLFVSPKHKMHIISTIVNASQHKYKSLDLFLVVVDTKLTQMLNMET